MEETILSKLKEEHRDIQVLLLRVERCKDTQKKQEYFDELKAVLLPHMEGEEQTLYAKLRTEVDDEDAAEVANLATYEHQEIRETITMLEDLDVGTGEWNELYSDLEENVRVHIEEEETDLFTEAKEDFSRDELVEIVGDFEDAKSHSTFYHH